MADVFLRRDAKSLLYNKNILLIGDSNMRAQYKDLIWILHNNTLIEYQALRRKLEPSYYGDYIVKKLQLTKSRNFTEHRLFKGGRQTIEFLFVTRCLNDDVRSILRDIKSRKRRAPDVIMMNSCLWDLTRWGPDGAAEYRKNMKDLMKLLEKSLPSYTKVIWATPPPLASKITGGLIIKQIEFLQETLSFEIRIAGEFIQKLVHSYGYDLIDFHYHLAFQAHRRSCDGVHYLPVPVRMMTNILFTHLSLSWGHTLPGNVTSRFLEEAILKAQPNQKIPDLDLSPKYWSPLLSASSYELPRHYNPRRAQAFRPLPWRQQVALLNQNQPSFPTDENVNCKYPSNQGRPAPHLIPIASRIPVAQSCNTPVTGRKFQSGKACRRRNLTESRRNYKPYNRGQR